MRCEEATEERSNMEDGERDEDERRWRCGLGDYSAKWFVHRNTYIPTGVIITPDFVPQVVSNKYKFRIPLRRPPHSETSVPIST